MIVVRDVFRLKFGKAREVLALMKREAMPREAAGRKPPDRVMTDLVGQFYTLVLESSYGSLAEYETNARSIMDNEEWRQWYQRLVPNIESGYREILKIVE